MKYYDKEIYNDYEIINVIKSGNEDVLNLIFEKYKPLIIKQVRYFGVKDHLDDCIQECNMLIYKAVYKFDEAKNKTFTKYLELILKRWAIAKINKKSLILMDIDKVEYFNIKEEKVDYSFNEYQSSKLSDVEQILLNEYLKNGKISLETKNKYGHKKVYNALYRARKKIKI